MSQSIDVNEIMRSIRAEIADKGYTADMLSFVDVPTEPDDTYTERFDADMLHNTVAACVEHYAVNPYKELHGNPIKVFFQRVVRKLISFYTEPYAAEQNQFNADAARMGQQMELFAQETRRTSNKVLLERIEQLEMQQKNNRLQIEALQKQLSELRTGADGGRA